MRNFIWGPMLVFSFLNYLSHFEVYIALNDDTNWPKEWLTILTGKDISNHSIQKFVITGTWLLLIDLYDIFTQVIWLLLCNKFYGISEWGFWLNGGPCFIKEIPNNCQWKKHSLFCKTIPGLFKIVRRLGGRHLFVWGMPKFKRLFLPSILMVFF